MNRWIVCWLATVWYFPTPVQADETVSISGEHYPWRNITLTLEGPFAREADTSPNPFTDYRFEVRFQHESGSPVYTVSGYFAADGNAANTSASSGNRWRAHLSPDKPGNWSYTVTFRHGQLAALNQDANSEAVAPYDGLSGRFEIKPPPGASTNPRDRGRLQYVGERYLKFAGSGDYFLKAGADAPETLLAYRDFDGTVARKKKVPLKTWSPHIQDWQPEDPTWKDGKGKGLIGAVNYLSGKGCNAFSFLTYNAGGDGDKLPLGARLSADACRPMCRAQHGSHLCRR